MLYQLYTVYCTLSRQPLTVALYSYIRGHTVRAVTESFQMSKDAGFKVVAHMMPDLPNVDIDRDVEQFIVSGCLTLSLDQ